MLHCSSLCFSLEREGMATYAHCLSGVQYCVTLWTHSVLHYVRKPKYFLWIKANHVACACMRMLTQLLLPSTGVCILTNVYLSQAVYGDMPEFVALLNA